VIRQSDEVDNRYLAVVVDVGRIHTVDRRTHEDVEYDLGRIRAIHETVAIRIATDKITLGLRGRGRQDHANHDGDERAQDKPSEGHLQYPPNQ
jgi:hypothetical protein